MLSGSGVEGVGGRYRRGLLGLVLLIEVVVAVGFGGGMDWMGSCAHRRTGRGV